MDVFLFDQKLMALKKVSLPSETNSFKDSPFLLLINTSINLDYLACCYVMYLVELVTEI